MPGLLTPNMQAWYSRYIAPYRVAGIAEIKNGFEADSATEGGAKGIYFENRRDFALQKSVNDGIAQAAAFVDKHREEVERRERDYVAFTTLRCQLNREPIRTRTWLYVLCLFGIVLLEAFINFESFLKVPYITSPFLATGATLAVGFGVGLAAHFHGIVFRQWGFLFSPQEAAELGHENRRKDAIRRLAIGAVLLGVALLMVGGSRYYYLRDYIVQSRILGIAPPSMFGGIIFMILGNVIAYFVGVLVSYAMHDPHPIYAERDRELRKSNLRMDELKRMREQAQKTLRQGTDNELKAASNQGATARGGRYSELRDHADLIVNKDQQVVGALIAYRNALLSAMGSRHAGKHFRYPDGAYTMLLPTTTELALSGEDYAGMPITLGFNIGEN
jgi:hypothetical protein